MPTPTESQIQEIHVELEGISQAWRALRAEYDEPDPEVPISPANWTEILTDNLLLNQQSRSNCTLAGAWSSVVCEARSIFLDRFAPWAVQVVSTFGIEKFPLDAQAPPQIERQAGTYELGESVQSLTGTSDTTDAGLRVILWAAAQRDPQLCRRSLEYPTLVWSWIRNFVEFGNGICRPVRELTVWLHNALDNLIQQIDSDEAGAEFQVEHVISDELSTQRYMLERLPDGSVQVQFSGEAGVFRGKFAHRVSLLIRQERVHLLEISGDVVGIRDGGVTVSPAEIALSELGDDVHTPGLDVLDRDTLEDAYGRLREILAALDETSDGVEREELEREQRRLRNTVYRMTHASPRQIQLARNRVDKNLRRVKNELLDSMPRFSAHLDAAIDFNNAENVYVYTPGEITWVIRGF